MTTYLDFNATTPVLPEVIDEMVSVYRENYGNAASRTHVFGQKANQKVEQSRKTIAALLQVPSHEVIFTSGATESNNLSILGLAEWGRENRRMHVITTKIEHNAVLEPMEYLASQGFEVEFVSPEKDGRVDSHEVLKRVRPDTLLVSVMHANNETGMIQPVQEIGEALRETETLFHVDASQTFGKLVEELRALHYDLLSFTSHKIYGPQGVGGLVVRRIEHLRSKIQPIMFGGKQERGIRPGTVPVALVAGFGKAAELASMHHKERYTSALGIKKSILDQLQEVNFTINGSMDHSLPTCINVSFHGIDSEAVMVGVKGEIAISNGSACTSAEYKPSHVLLAMEADAENAVRISWGPQMQEVNIGPLVQFVKRFQW